MGYQVSKRGEAFAVVSFYEPFTMGGNVWQERRFKVKCEFFKCQGFDLFWFYDKVGNVYRAHEVTTGVMVCKAKTDHAVKAKASALIKITPDFEKQIAQKGSHERFQIVEAEDALTRLKKGDDEEAARRPKQKRVRRAPKST